MSSSAPTKRDHQPNTLSPGHGLLQWATDLLSTTVGSKIVVALTGLGLTGFVIAHLIGNLKIFDGQDAINGYARFLKDLGPWLWAARIGLLTVFLLHITLAILLKARSARARPIRYQHAATIQATSASRTMLSTGVVIGVFVLFHLAHFTFAWVSTTTAISMSGDQPAFVESNYLNLVDAKGRHDVYSMVVAGFKNPVIAVFYFLAQLVIFVHLSHGISSTFQTLGFNTPRFQKFIKSFGLGLAALIAIGNISIVAAVWGGAIPTVTVLTSLPATR
jgi:succinate dehydrogenase cytochrome b subunit